MDRLPDSGYDEGSSPDTLDEGTMVSSDVISLYKDVPITEKYDKLSIIHDMHHLGPKSVSNPPPLPYRNNVGSWRLLTVGERQIKEAKLLWTKQDYRHIWDVEFLDDGALVVITGMRYTMEGKVVTIEDKVLRCMNIDGKELGQPFPGRYHDPGGVSMCRRTSNIVVTDTVPGQSHGVVTILKHDGYQWVYKSHQANRTAFRVALTETDTAVCVVRWEKIVKYHGNQVIWSRSIASTNDLVPYINIDGHGRIIVSTPVTNRISVFSSEGQLLVVFPSWHIKKPTGVCSASNGSILVADAANHRISQFTIKGHFIQTILETEYPPTCLALFGDTHLAIGSHFDGLSMYELEWQ